jgi:hypothetical protein
MSWPNSAKICAFRIRTIDGYASKLALTEVVTGNLMKDRGRTIESDFRIETISRSEDFNLSFWRTVPDRENLLQLRVVYEVRSNSG